MLMLEGRDTQEGVRETLEATDLSPPLHYWGEPERAPLKREVGTVVHARKTTAKSGLPHTTVSLVGWFMHNDKRINYVKSIQVHM